MPKNNLIIRGYISFVVFVGLLLGLISLRFYSNQANLLRDTILLIIAASLAENYSLSMGRNYIFSAHPAIHIAIIFLLPPPISIFVTLVAIGIHELFEKIAWYKKLFNISHHVIVTAVPAFLIYWSGNWADARNADQHPQFFLIAPIILGIYHILDVGLVDLAIALSTAQNFMKLWLQINRKIFIFDITIASMGILLAVVWQYSPLFGLLLILPLIVNHYAVKNLSRLEAETKEAVLKIMEVLEARDPYTAGHSMRVGQYCQAICEKLDLEQEETEKIVLAGKLHDLGKIGVSDAVLNKPGKLTEAEWAQMRQHPQIGADILGKYSLYKEGVKLILHHHEAWDGSGYPAQLSGGLIPLGARIISVADAFDAMTTDRPYRNAMSAEVAASILLENRNKQWDGQIVDTFLTTLELAPALPESAVITISPKALKVHGLLPAADA